MVQTYGSLDRPARLDMWTRIIDVGWSVGGTVIVEVTAPETKFYDVLITTPEDVLLDFFSEITINEDQYKDVFGYKIGIAGSTGSVIVESEISDIWLWDGSYIGTNCEVVHAGSPGLIEQCNTSNNTAVTNGNSTFGYSANIALVGQQVKRNQLTPPFGSYLLGDVQEHTHPNGAKVKYFSGYTALNRGPQYDQFGQPFGDFDYIATKAWYWYRTINRPPREAAILRKSYLINFRSNFSRIAELRDYHSDLDFPTEWSIRGYLGNTEFTISEGRVTPVGGVSATFSASGSEAGGHDGVIRRFNGKGFL
jgi:hypothetical protein